MQLEVASPPHPSLFRRKIIHFDMDAFYASVEVRDDPKLKGLPVVVGGPPDSRAVVCAASYEARKFGVHSAMPCSRAARLCPKAVFIRPNFDKYREASQAIRAVFSRYTDLIEPLSLDEAYLDVTGNKFGLYAVQIARRIQQEIFAELRLTGSAGIAPNKLLAKIASDLRKPFGLSVVLPTDVLAFMEKLPLRKIHGIGPATERRLTSLGLVNCPDVWPWSLADLEDKVGNMAAWLYQRARGIDERPVVTSRVRRSLSKERTFSRDVTDGPELRQSLANVAVEVAASLATRGLVGRTVTLKLKLADFSQLTRRRTRPVAPTTSSDIQSIAAELLDLALGELPLATKFRLIGIGLSNFDSATPEPKAPLGLMVSAPLDGDFLE